MNYHSYKDVIIRYFSFSKFELRAFIISVLIFAFIENFDRWGESVFDATVGLQNLLLSIVVVASALFVHHAGQRLAGLYYGFRVEQQLWWHGLLLGLIGVIVTNGWLKLFFGSGTLIYVLETHRLGKHRYGANLLDFSRVCLWGVLANVFFAAVVKTLQLWTPLPLNPVAVDRIFFFNLYFAVLNLIPIPPLDGSRILFASRLLYAFVMSALAGYLVLVYFFGVFSFFYSFAIGIGCALLFYILLERGWEK